MRKILAVLLCGVAFCLPTYAQSFVAAGATVGNESNTGTVAGGFVEGQYNLLKFVQVHGKMTINNQAPFINGDTVYGYSPEMRMVIDQGRLDIVLGAGIDGNTSNGTTINPIGSIGFVIDKKYAGRITYIFDRMAGDGIPGAPDYKGIRFGGDALIPFTKESRFALRLGGDLDVIAGRKQFKSFIGIAIR